MKPKLVTYHCIKHYSKCLMEWEQMTTDDPPYYDVCKNCYALMCADERETLSDLD